MRRVTWDSLSGCQIPLGLQPPGAVQVFCLVRRGCEAKHALGAPGPFANPEAWVQDSRLEPYERRMLVMLHSERQPGTLWLSRVV